MMMTLHCPTCGDSRIDGGTFVAPCADPFHRTPHHDGDELAALLGEALPFVTDAALNATIRAVLEDLATWKDVMARMPSWSGFARVGALSQDTESPEPLLAHAPEHAHPRHHDDPPSHDKHGMALAHAHPLSSAPHDPSESSPMTDVVLSTGTRVRFSQTPTTADVAALTSMLAQSPEEPA
jgi:hypothetical protein